MRVTLLTVSVALSTLFCPRKIEEMVEPPAAMSTQKATTRFISGKVMARPEIAIGPTPRPMKMESTILYSEVTSAAMMAGREYCTNSFPIGLVPRADAEVWGLGSDASICICRLLNEKKAVGMRSDGFHLVAGAGLEPTTFGL